jgi:hypothetical protein
VNLKRISKVIGQQLVDILRGIQVYFLSSPASQCVFQIDRMAANAHLEFLGVQVPAGFGRCDMEGMVGEE